MTKTEASERGVAPAAPAAGLQGIYFLATGLWPLLSRRTFIRATGPKFDFWLVNTVGALVAAIGGALTLAALRRRVTAEIQLLGLGSAAALAAVDVYYYRQGKIPPVYLVDALAELFLILLWLGRRR